MARRSATNRRYQKGTATGKTRRSSASLKPKREAGSAPAPAKSAKRGPAADPPEVKRWRRLWWVFLAVALVPVAYMFVPPLLIEGWKPDPQIARYGLAVEFGAFAAALYIDFAIIRRIRKEAAAGKVTKERKDAEE